MAIVVLFLVTELPQGALALCSGLVEQCFHSYYSPLGDTMDIVALVNNGINFALYCTMSARFRQTFTGLIWTPMQQNADDPLLSRRRRSHHDGDGQVSYVSGGAATWKMTTNDAEPEPELNNQLETNL